MEAPIIIDQETTSTWNRERSTEELRSYVTSRLASLSDFELDLA